MSCTDPEFAESMRRKSPEEVMFGGRSPYGAEELTVAIAPVIALKALADAIAGATHGERVGAATERHEQLSRALEAARGEAEALNPGGVTGVWVGLGMQFRYGRPRAAVCLDCGWVGKVTRHEDAVAEALTHRC